MHDPRNGDRSGKGRESMKWAAYCRISLDRMGDGEKVADQRLLLDRLITTEDPAAEITYYEDDDTSGWSGVERRGYERLVIDCAAGMFERVATKETERLWRNVTEQEAFKLAVSGTPLREVVTLTQRFKLDDVDDAFMLTLAAALGARESGKTSKRMKDRQALKAERGGHHGGPRAFGHTVSRDALVEEEAALIREAAERVIRGESMRSIVIEWNQRGVQSARQVPWRVDSLRDLLRQPRLAGLREHHGKLYEATWPAIIDRTTHEQLVAMFESRKRGPNGSTREARKNLLAGMLRCPKCERYMVGTGDRYRCQAPGSGGCSGATVRVVHADQAVTDKVLAYLDSEKFAKALARATKAADKRAGDSAKLLAAIQKDRRALENLATEYDDGLIDRAEYRTRRDRLQARIAENDGKLARAEASVAPAARLEGRGAKLRRGWERMTLAERRDVLRTIIAYVKVHPAQIPVNRFNPDRIEPVWRF
jgi:DNA invertase Pin-like site-specific DNA recombinase